MGSSEDIFLAKTSRTESRETSLNMFLISNKSIAREFEEVAGEPWSICSARAWIE
jgi:hypothetical protein